MSIGRQAFVLLEAVVLVVTGGEALYADMGHFGRTTDSPSLPGSDPRAAGASCSIISARVR